MVHKLKLAESTLPQTFKFVVGDSLLVYNAEKINKEYKVSWESKIRTESTETFIDENTVHHYFNAGWYKFVD